VLKPGVSNGDYRNVESNVVYSVETPSAGWERILAVVENVE
jgi:hypothetical protein